MAHRNCNLGVVVEAYHPSILREEKYNGQANLGHIVRLCTNTPQLLPPNPKYRKISPYLSLGPPTEAGC